MPAVSYLASPSATRAVLERHGLATKKALGQNFLVNDAVIARICELSDVCADDTVLEVGPGIGTLTVALLERADRVLSVERDADLPAVLAETCGSFDNFSLLSKDALALTQDDVDAVFGDAARAATAPNKFIANLPYAVAATLVLDFFQRFASVRSATVMVQSEVADRMMAEVGTKNYGAYTVKLNLIARATGRFQVAPGSFFPPPRVTSSVIRLDRRDDAIADDREIAVASLMADAAFATRRKTMANSMKTYFSGRKGFDGVAESLPDVFDAAGIDARRRGESLSLQEFVELGRAFSEVTGK
ncbi:MAG: 16S rRNA (adenine(1518)-N(6)/adenine(1519)-N(6))-dimethyltransferase RsmA [Slackia sp.]|nr:16S rRNA (adenine(1518)-N(6)/adenine(1519)-N(6))-dimethyltransferase RsmA [Slackia sp.]